MARNEEAASEGVEVLYLRIPPSLKRFFEGLADIETQNRNRKVSVNTVLTEILEDYKNFMENPPEGEEN